MVTWQASIGHGLAEQKMHLSASALHFKTFWCWGTVSSEKSSSLRPKA